MTVYTIGHSHVPIERFIGLLGQHQIAVVIDARSHPYSRYAPQFRRKALQAALLQAGIAYLYLGDQLGGRPKDARYYSPDGKVDYSRLAQAPAYRRGLQRLKVEAEQTRVAVLCSEADYRKCHRYWLIAHSLVKEGVEVRHILHTGGLVHTPAGGFLGPADQQHLL